MYYLKVHQFAFSEVKYSYVHHIYVPHGYITGRPDNQPAVHLHNENPDYHARSANCITAQLPMHT